MRWYSVSVLSNFERKVAEAIREAAAQHHLEDQITQVEVPIEQVIEICRGKKVQTEKRFMPGYVLVRMEMTDRTYHSDQRDQSRDRLSWPAGQTVADAR